MLPILSPIFIFPVSLVLSIISIFIPISALHKTAVKQKVMLVKTANSHPTSSETLMPTLSPRFINSHSIRLTISPPPTAIPSQSSSSNNSQLAPVISTGVSVVKVGASGTVHGSTTISTQGKTITLSFTYPVNGGNINGFITGDCKGSISGTYSTDGFLNGLGNATCQEGFFSVPVSINYTGNVTSGSAKVHYTVSTLGQVEAGDTSFLLQ